MMLMRMRILAEDAGMSRMRMLNRDARDAQHDQPGPL